ncbi:MAG: hypothetical protein AAF903_09185 [Pseudomonadota bacterium]
MQNPREGFTDPWSRKWQETPASRTLVLARFVGLFAAASAGLAVGLGSYTDIVASDGPANFILPFVIAIAVGVGLGAGWHLVLGMGAAARTTENRIATLALGLGLAVIGAGTSAWFLAAKIGGSSAIQTHQQAYLKELNTAERAIAGNLSRERVLIAVAGRGRNALESTAKDEGQFGAVSGKSGFAAVFSALKNAAGGLQDTQAELQRQADRADNLLSQARQSIERAGQAISDATRAEFEKAVGSAVSRLGDANHIRLSDTLLSAGDVDASGPAASNIGDVIDGLRRSVRSLTTDIRSVSIPTYTPMDGKAAVVAYPQALPWLMAILIECLPLLMLCIMLARFDGQDIELVNANASKAAPHRDDYEGDTATQAGSPAPRTAAQARPRRSRRHQNPSRDRRAA